ncbi:site-specific integrase [Kineosporia sp. NBRC 101731]|uniref:tyrosine-type recombinase/integrase n=1 Tax=Kineosporia sp. NBRC 101731 TaxID=3032199 RepID=UPI0024A382AB|nr:site-specific integrase [Kineosporia sp. NBRC 101731]GLY27436.1 phage integrase [Kineosporia sp. NBRC 101731]
MARQSLPLGTYGKVKTWQDGSSWIARAQYRDLDGVVRPVKRRGKSQAAAERSLKEALRDRQTPLKDSEVAPGTKIAKVAELWLAEMETLVDEGTRSPGTYDTYKSVYGTHVKPVLGSLTVREVTTPVVDRVLTTIKKKSSSRARTAKIVISGIMKYAARHGAVTVNPVREVGRIDSTPKRRPRAMTAAERKQWLDAVESSEKARTWDLPDLTRMMLATGCRIGECLAIGWSDVDLEEETVDIAWRLVRRSGAGLSRLSSTKTGVKGERLIPLPSWAVGMLKRRRAVIAPETAPIFPDSLGGWRDPSNVRRVWREIRDDAEMGDLVSHTLRKTVASFLDDADISTRKISDQLGHAKVSMTQDRYLGRRLRDRQTADVLENVIDEV